MTQPPALTDRIALSRYCQRATMDEIQQRLATVNRSFTAQAVATAQPDIWQTGLYDTQLIRGGDTLHELRQSLTNTEQALMGDVSPRVAPMVQLRDLVGALQRAGRAVSQAPVRPARRMRQRQVDLSDLLGTTCRSAKKRQNRPAYRCIWPRHSSRQAAPNRIYPANSMIDPTSKPSISL